MLISIIIPVFNEQENLAKKLPFLCKEAQKYPIEIIVSNSPETSDRSAEVCKNHAKVTILKSNKKGRAAQMNFAASKAQGDILLFLHADVQLPVDFYIQVKKAINTGFKFGFFAYEFDKKSALLDFNSRFTNKDGWFAGGGDQCHFFVKDTFLELKGYNEKFCIMEDFKMMQTIREHKIKFTIIQSKAIVSARKYKQNSWLKVNIINAIIFLQFKLGVSPKKLRVRYTSLLREKP